MNRSWTKALFHFTRRNVVYGGATEDTQTRRNLVRLNTVGVFVLIVLFCLGLPWRYGSGEALSRSGDEQLTIILNTFKRLDLLERSVQHYSQCPVVKRIHVNWAESATPPDLSRATCCNTHVTFALPLLTHNDSSLNTRFLPVPDLKTDAVLNIDDDITVSCASVLQTMRTWQEHPDQLVGWFPRHVTTTNGVNALHYRTHTKTLLYDRKYNVILTKGAIMHHKYLEAYSTETPQELRDLVAERRNCEDILMQFVISSRTKSTPVFEWDVTLHDSGAGWKPDNPGISRNSKHMKVRSQCVSDFEKVFGSLATRSIWSHPDGLLLMLSPPLDSLYQMFHGAPAQRQCKCGSAIKRWIPPPAAMERVI